LGQTKEYKGVGMIRVNFGPFSETVYIILNTVIERSEKCITYAIEYIRIK
jgi:hypothetical protein